MVAYHLVMRRECVDIVDMQQGGWSLTLILRRGGNGAQAEPTGTVHQKAAILRLRSSSLQEQKWNSEKRQHFAVFCIFSSQD
jgi:hypothetical protein